MTKSKQAQAKRGQDAAQVLENDAIKEALAWMQESVLKDLRAARRPGETWYVKVELDMLDSFTTLLHAYVHSGKQAAEALRVAQKESRIQPDPLDLEAATWVEKAAAARKQWEQSGGSAGNGSQ